MSEASELLTCTVCPRQQRFSDISHLLTHVDSKGHLAHLHKLRVRSHRDLHAGVQLTNFLQWYQQYGIEQLLSERMTMKQVKASKRARIGVAKAESKYVKNESQLDALTTESSPSRNVTRNRARTRAKRAKRQQVPDEQATDLDYSPIQGMRRSERISSYLITPVKKTPLPSSPPADELVNIDPDLITPHQNAKLKGKIFKGMDLFDAATPEEARRRNQKKDGSVVKKMERLSRLVEPLEAVYDMDWDMKKRRHIDDLEDNISLIEGETPVTKTKIKTRANRKVFSRVSANVPRLVRRKAKLPRVRSPKRNNDQVRLPRIGRIPSSSALVTDSAPIQYSPTDEETAEFQQTVKGMSLRKRAGNFTIFTDGTAAYAPTVPTYAPQHVSLNQSYSGPMPQRLVFPGPNPAWLQPQNQNPLYLSSNTAFRPLYQTYSEGHDLGKENVPPMINAMDNVTVNPLTWKPQFSDGMAEATPSESSFGNYNGYSGYFANASGLNDPFGYQRNSLTDSFEPFATHQNTEPGRDHDQGIDEPSSDESDQERVTGA